MVREMDENSFATQWEENWNRHDLDAIMLHYRDDIVFRSQKAAALVGSGELKGKTALRDYWARAIALQPELKFRVQDVFVGYQMLVISYLNHRDVMAVETLYFDMDGLVYQAAACHRSIRPC